MLAPKHALDPLAYSGGLPAANAECHGECGSTNKKARSSFEAGLFRLKMAWR